MPRKPIGMDALELAARHLSAWNGSGQSWHVDWEEAKLGRLDAGWRDPLADAAPDLADVPKSRARSLGGPDALSICWRGRVEEQAGARVRGTTRVRRMHGWAKAGGTVALPRHRSLADAAGALSYAKLPKPLAAILLLYACEDLRQWPTVDRYARLCLPGCCPDAIGDAMQRIMWGSRGRYSPTPQDQRARQVGIQAARFRQQTRRADSKLREWLDRAAWSFLEALSEARDDEAVNSRRTTCRPAGCLPSRGTAGTPAWPRPWDRMNPVWVREPVES